MVRAFEVLWSGAHSIGSWSRIPLLAAFGVTIPFAVLAVFFGLEAPIVAAALLASVAFLLVTRANPNLIASGLVVTSLLMLRPGVASEFVAIYGTALAILAATIALTADLPSLRYSGTWALTVGLLALAYGWALALSTSGAVPASQVIQGFVTTVVSLLAIGVVVADSRRRLFIVRAFVFLVTLVGVSYLVTFALWCIAGFGSFQLASFPISRSGFVGQLYFPFTLTSGTQAVGAITFPRLTGMGREPGWMALWGIVAWLLWPAVQAKPRPLLRLLVIPTILGPVSSAGFEVFAFVVVFSWFVRPRAHLSVPAVIGRFIGGLVTMAIGWWVIVYAPVLGFNDKSTYNLTSFTDRQTQVNEGLKAISTAPWGGTNNAETGSINLIAAIAPEGLPYVLLVVAALLLPLLLRTRGVRATPVVLAILLTLVIAQPPGDSVVAFVLAGLGVLVSSDEYCHRSAAGPGFVPTVIPIQGSAPL